ncbi:hypothetical protein AVEN_68776-1 [Araneus ventricosus]|uniref:Uncharacterized protein n=1 Tax=Araneus ventricosus TaxID=182803 RepID=A0A4Y2C573_ARAVE|nr:hypothetical protein AVEN_68776-1 [Araneus ventricosus]
MLLDRKIKLESEYFRISPLKQNIFVGGRLFQPCDYEVKVYGWQNQSAECITEERIISEEDLEDKGLINILTDSSKSELVHAQLSACWTSISKFQCTMQR